MYVSLLLMFDGGCQRFVVWCSLAYVGWLLLWLVLLSIGCWLLVVDRCSFIVAC